MKTPETNAREIELLRYQEKMKKRISKKMDTIQTAASSPDLNSDEKNDLLTSVFSFIEAQA